MSENKTSSVPKSPTEEKPYLITFSKPHSFEGKEYTSIDLSGLENLTSEDFFEVSRRFSTERYITPRPESDPEYCCMIAGIACKQPPEFFIKLPLRDARKVRDMVFNFFHNEASLV